MKKNGKAFILFALSLVSFSLNFTPSLTGNIIGSSLNDFNIPTILGFVFLIGSFVMLLSKKTLDKLVIPGGEDDLKEGRLNRTLVEKKSGRKIKKMYWLKGEDSEEDILILGKKVKSGERVGFVTFPIHYLEYKELIKKAQRDGTFPKGVKTENLATEQGPKEWLYGVLGLTEEIIKRRKLDYRVDRKEKYLQKIKEIAHKIIG